MEKRKRLILVQPPRDAAKDGIKPVFHKLPPPLNLIIVAEETSRRLSANIEISILQPETIDKKIISRLAETEYLGLSSWFSNHDCAMKLARDVKKINVDVQTVVGGPNATNLSRQILCNHPEIDFVISGDGEDALWRLIADHPLDSIPNLRYRCDKRHISTRRQNADIDRFATWDFRFLRDFDLSPYDSRLEEYRFDVNLAPICLSNSRGCRKACHRQRCAYCSIPGKSLRLVQPQKAWEQMTNLYERYGIVSFMETGDDFTIPEYLTELVRTKPGTPPFNLRIYAGVNGLTDEVVSSLCQIGQIEVFLGLETTDQKISLQSGREYEPAKLMGALDRLRDHGCSICLPFMFGLPGETGESANKTVDFALNVAETHRPRMVLVSLAVPIAGSRWFQKLSNDPVVHKNYFLQTGRDLKMDDSPDYKILWLETNKGHEDSIISAYDRLRNLLPQRIEFGDFGGLRNLF